MNFESAFNKNKEKENKKEWIELVRGYYSGEMHAHSLHSSRDELDGAKEGMVHQDTRILQYADKLGLDFVCFSEHASNPGYPVKLEENHPICKSLLDQQEKIRELNKSGKYKTKAYSSVESSIFFDDENKTHIDMPDSVLTKMDLVIASRHAIKNQFEPDKIRESFLKAINNQNIDIIGHPYRNIEFYKHDWNFFKKYNRKDEKNTKKLNQIERVGDQKSIKQIIGKLELSDASDEIVDLNKQFEELKLSYWSAWEDILIAMEEKGKVFEINLSSFNPNKEFFITLLTKTTKHKNLKYSIGFDFHHLGQMENYDNKNTTIEAPKEIKNKSRAKGVQRLLELINLLKDLDISPDRIINSSKENLEDFLNKKEERKKDY